MHPDLLTQSSTPLVDALKHSAHRPHAPFYTPGHKRGKGIPPGLVEVLGGEVFRADLPELPELDNLFAPHGVIQQAQALAAQAFGADQTWFLVNGSTSGVIAAILATCAPGDKILLPRNVHQSAISGLILSGAIPVFLPPEYDPVLDIAHGVTSNTIATALGHHPDAKAVLLVSPTYYGACGDIGAIASLTHSHGIPLLVDEAHGAHFAFHPGLPTPALAAGADLAVQSTHKTLAALTQGAMVHIRGNRIHPDRLSKALQLVQSTSPSYLLLAALDAARHQMATQGEELLERTLQLADQARSRLSQIPGLSVLHPEQAGSPGFVALDRTRLTVTVAGLGLDGFTADELLQTLGVTAEFPSLRHLTFIWSLGNTWEDGEQLVTGFKQLAETRSSVPGEAFPSPPVPPSSTQLLSPREAFFAPKVPRPIHQAVNHISAELVCPYPPGIPLLLPGEVITFPAIVYLQKVLSMGGFISGCADPNLQTLQVVQMANSC